MPEAVNCRVTPTGMLGLAGVTAMETSVTDVPLLLLPHAVRNTAKDPRNNIAKANLIFFIMTPRFTPTRGHCTVRVVFPKAPEAALMVAEPVATAVARPLPLTVATGGLDEVQTTCLVISWLVPSEYMPNAVNCWVAPTGMLGLAGVTDMEARVAEVTVRAVLPVIVPEAAVMVAVAATAVVAKPLLLTVATDVLDEVQMTSVVISWAVPSEYKPEAANCWVTPPGMLRLAGVTDMEDRVAGVTVRVVLPRMVPEAAVMVVIPGAMDVAEPLLSTTATEVTDELQTTCVVISKRVPSEYVPEAANWVASPTGMLGLTGVTDIEDRAAEVTVRVLLPEMVPEVAVMVTVPAATAVARPLLSTVAINVLDELQMTCVLISKPAPFEKAPEAVNWGVNPTGTLGLAVVTDIKDRTAGSTVRFVLPKIVPEVAVMVTVPGAMAVAKPLRSTVANDVLDEVQMTCVVISKLVPSR
jgi:hypothetical protein